MLTFVINWSKKFYFYKSINIKYNLKHKQNNNKHHKNINPHNNPLLEYKQLIIFIKIHTIKYNLLK